MNQNLSSKIRIAAGILALAATLPSAAMEPAGNMSLGLRTGYVSQNESALAGLYFQYRFTPHFRLAPSADYVFRRNDRDALLLNLDAQVPFSLGTGRVAVYPLAGLNFSAWSHHLKNDTSDDVTTRVSRFGVNVGAGAEFYVSSTLKLAIEGKFVGVKGYSCGEATVSIGYVF
jgi:hypothetical protein